MTLENLQKVLTALQAQIPSTAFIGNREDDDPVVLCIDVVQDAIKLSELDTPIGVISEDLLPKSPIFRKKSEIVLSKEQIAQIMNPPKTTFSKNDRPKLYAAAEEMLEESCGNQEAALAKYIETAESLGCGVIVIDAAPPRGEVIIQKQGRNFATEQGSGSDTVVKFYEGPCDQEVGNQTVCGCGATCWACGISISEPCWGEMHVSEDYPGCYTHFCDGHGHFEDGESYKHEPQVAEPKPCKPD